MSRCANSGLTLAHAPIAVPSRDGSGVGTSLAATLVMRSSRILGLGLIPALALLSCGGKHASSASPDAAVAAPDATTGPASLETSLSEDARTHFRIFFDQWRQKTAERQIECLRLEWDSAQVLNARSAVERDRAEEGLAGGRYHLNESKLAACLQSLMLSCEQWLETGVFAGPDICEEVLEGQVGLGGFCNDDGECAGGDLYCQAAPDCAAHADSLAATICACRPVCVRAGPLGARCLADRECGVAHYCHIVDNAGDCRERIPEGATCELGGCEPGFACLPTSDAGSRCAKNPVLGTPCRTNDGCAPVLVCANDSDAPTGRCAVGSALTQPCTPSSQAKPCAPGASCDPVLGICLPPYTPHCPGSTPCLGGYCLGSGAAAICQPFAGIGQPCPQGNECGLEVACGGPSGKLTCRPSDPKVGEPCVVRTTDTGPTDGVDNCVSSRCDRATFVCVPTPPPAPPKQLGDACGQVEDVCNGFGVVCLDGYCKVCP
jgi:hypothetical protein